MSSTDVVMPTKKSSWKVGMSNMAQKTFNPIRHIVDNMKTEPHPDKPMIALSIGDPTVFGNLPTPEVCETAVIKSINKKKYNGYTASVGYKESRQAVADYVSTDGLKVEAKDVILTSGCSGALDICISCLADPGQNILVPRPGFSLYKTLADSLSIETRHYDLLPERSWEIDLEHLESLIDDNTATIIVCNPSNPCGSVFEPEHILAILQLADKYKIPIIADEVYDRFVFEGYEYHSFPAMSKNVPILSCGGLTKRFLVPGWRMGWIVVHDRQNAFADVTSGLIKLSQRILGPCTLVQSALPDILSNTPQSFFTEVTRYLQDNARTFFSHLSSVPGLRPVMPHGAMYMMVGIDLEHYPDFKNDVEFTENLVTEQSVFCLPTACFQYPGFFRVVLTIPKDKVLEACVRMEEFCRVHYTPTAKNGHANNGTAKKTNGQPHVHASMVTNGQK